MFLIHLNGASSFSNFDGLNVFSPISTGPWPQLQKGRKIPEIKQKSDF